MCTELNYCATFQIVECLNHGTLEHTVLSAAREAEQVRSKSLCNYGLVLNEDLHNSFQSTHLRTQSKHSPLLHSLSLSHPLFHSHQCLTTLSPIFRSNGWVWWFVSVCKCVFGLPLGESRAAAQWIMFHHWLSDVQSEGFADDTTA